jgi:hypothetical protein
MDSPIAFGFRFFESNVHTRVLARQKVANKAIGELIGTECRRSKIIEFILRLTQCA